MMRRRLEGRCLPSAGWSLGSAVGYEAVVPRACPAKFKSIAESMSRAAGTGPRSYGEAKLNCSASPSARIYARLHPESCGRSSGRSMRAASQPDSPASYRAEIFSEASRHHVAAGWWTASQALADADSDANTGLSEDVSRPP